MQLSRSGRAPGVRCTSQLVQSMYSCGVGIDKAQVVHRNGRQYCTERNAAGAVQGARRSFVWHCAQDGDPLCIV